MNTRTTRPRTPICGSFAQWVTKHREAQGLNKSQLAVKAGVNRTLLVMMETNLSDPNLANAFLIAHGLGKTLADFENDITGGKL